MLTLLDHDTAVILGKWWPDVTTDPDRQDGVWLRFLATDFVSNKKLSASYKKTNKCNFMCSDQLFFQCFCRLSLKTVKSPLWMTGSLFLSELYSTIFQMYLKIWLDIRRSVWMDGPRKRTIPAILTSVFIFFRIAQEATSNRPTSIILLVSID